MKFETPIKTSLKHNTITAL